MKSVLVNSRFYYFCFCSLWAARPQWPTCSLVRPLRGVLTCVLQLGSIHRESLYVIDFPAELHRNFFPIYIIIELWRMCKVTHQSGTVSWSDAMCTSVGETIPLPLELTAHHYCYMTVTQFKRKDSSIKNWTPFSSKILNSLHTLKLQLQSIGKK